MQQLNDITHAIIGASFRISTKLGPGLLESVYETVLARDLARAGFQVERQKHISFDFEGLWFENAFKIDLVVDQRVAVEIKSVREVTPEFKKQLLTYLRLADLRVGLLLNFGAANLKDGITRMVN